MFAAIHKNHTTQHPNPQHNTIFQCKNFTKYLQNKNIATNFALANQNKVPWPSG